VGTYDSKFAGNVRQGNCAKRTFIRVPLPIRAEVLMFPVPRIGLKPATSFFVELYDAASLTNDVRDEDKNLRFYVS